MSPLYLPCAFEEYPNPAQGVFFDDFIGSSYDSQTWSITGATITWLNQLGGRIQINAPIGVASATFAMTDVLNYSAATRIEIEWYGRMTPPTGGNTECGVMSAGGTEWVAWYYNPSTSANFRCQTSATNTDSLVAGDNNDHLFEIIINTGVAEFWLDGVLRATNTTNVSTLGLQPYAWLTASGTTASTMNMDFVKVTGNRS
jgi:hypothetical protein